MLLFLLLRWLRGRGFLLLAVLRRLCFGLLASGRFQLRGRRTRGRFDFLGRRLGGRRGNFRPIALGDEDDRLGGGALIGALEDRDGERGGFAGAGAGLAQNINPSQGTGDEQRLDFRRGLEFRFRETAQERAADAQRCECFGDGWVFRFVGQEAKSFTHHPQRAEPSVG